MRLGWCAVVVLTACSSSGVSSNPTDSQLDMSVPSDFTVLRHRGETCGPGMPPCESGLSCATGDPNGLSYCVSQSCSAPDAGSTTHNFDFGLCSNMGPGSMTTGPHCSVESACGGHQYFLACDGTNCTCYVDGCVERSFPQASDFCPTTAPVEDWLNKVATMCSFP